MNKLRLLSILALFCVAITLGGVWYELHQLRTSWRPVVALSTGGEEEPGEPTKFEVEIKEPVTIEATGGLDVNVQR